VNYAKLLEMNSFFTLHSFLEVGKTQDLPSKFWQTLGDALRDYPRVAVEFERVFRDAMDHCDYLVAHKNSEHVEMTPRVTVIHYVKTAFGNGCRSPLVTGNAPVTDQVFQISQER
jgi:hypothetical protein